MEKNDNLCPSDFKSIVTLMSSRFKKYSICLIFELVVHLHGSKFKNYIKVYSENFLFHLVTQLTHSHFLDSRKSPLGFLLSDRGFFMLNILWNFCFCLILISFTF
jgi:hypothetical protein